MQYRVRVYYPLVPAIIYALPILRAIVLLAPFSGTLLSFVHFILAILLPIAAKDLYAGYLKR